MKFGEYMKRKREGMGWSQPVAAKHIGIEQSYLSKLETGKSYPSDEIVEKLVEAYAINSEEMTESIGSEELQRLDHVKSVRVAMLEQFQRGTVLSQRWIYAGLLSVVLGGACLGAAIIPQTSQTQFRYRSEGVLLPGEPLTAFANIYTDDSSDSGAMLDRVDQDDQLLSVFRGHNYIETSSAGRRYYQMYAQPESGGLSAMRYFLIPALMFIMGGLGSFFIGFKWKSKL